MSNLNQTVYKIESGAYSIYLNCGNIKFPLHQCELMNESNKEYFNEFISFLEDKKSASSKWSFKKELYKVKNSSQSVVYKISYEFETKEPLDFIFTIYDEHTPFKELSDFSSWVNSKY